MTVGLGSCSKSQHKICVGESEGVINIFSASVGIKVIKHSKM